MTATTLREQMYRRWKKGEDYFVLAKEMGVTRERMRIILKKMDAEVPLVDQIEAQAAEIERLRGYLAKAVQFTKGVIRHAGNSGDDYLAEQARTALAELTGAKT